MGLGIELIVPASLLDPEAGNVLINALRHNSPQIAFDVLLRIRERTPRLTGGLREAESDQAYTSQVSGSVGVNLAKWYCEDGPQIDAWGRVYAPYQEGDLSTYTNEPHHMFARTETDDLGLIDAWATAAVQGAADALGAGALETLTYGDA